MSMLGSDSGETTAEMYARELNWENIEEAARILDMHVNYTDTRILTITRMMLQLAKRQEQIIKCLDARVIMSIHDEDELTG